MKEIDVARTKKANIEKMGNFFFFFGLLANFSISNIKK